MVEELTNIKVTMAELKKDIGFIRESLTSNADEHKELKRSQLAVQASIDGFIKTSTDCFVDKKNHKETIAKLDSMIKISDAKIESAKIVAEENYVRKDMLALELKPLKDIVYKAVAIILTAFLLSVSASVWIK
jgi:chromosome segregation ATPase